MVVQESDKAKTDNKSSREGPLVASSGLREVDPEDANRRVNLKKLITVVRIKTERSERGRSFASFTIWLAFYVCAIVLQRKANYASYMYTGLMDYYTTAAFRDPTTFEIKRYQDVTTSWLRGVFVEKSLIDTYDNNGTAVTGTDVGRLLQFNRIVNNLRLTQRRALNGTQSNCVSRPMFQNFTPNCYGATFLKGTVGNVDTSDFLDSARPSIVYQWQSLHTFFIPGFTSLENGYYQYLPLNKSQAVDMLLDLWRGTWINQGTSFLRADFVAYNSNVRLFGIIKFEFLFMPTGQIVTSKSGTTMPAGYYSTAADQQRLAIEVIALLLWISQASSLAKKVNNALYRERSIFAYFKGFEEIMEGCQHLLFVIIMGFWTTIVVKTSVNDYQVTTTGITSASTGQPDFDALSELVRDYFILNAICLLISLLRILDFARVNPNIARLADTFNKCRRNLLEFLFVLITLLLAFALMAHLMFGDHLSNYVSLDLAFISCVQFLIGGADYGTFADANPAAAPLYFFSFLLIMVFVVFNMTIAIIMDGYSAVEEEKSMFKADDMTDLVSTSIFHQAWHGFLRITAMLRFMFPKKIGALLVRFRKLSPGNDGIIVDRYEDVPSKPQADDLLRPLSLFEEDTLSLSECLRRLNNANLYRQTWETIAEEAAEGEDVQAAAPVQATTPEKEKPWTSSNRDMMLTLWELNCIVHQYNAWAKDDEKAIVDKNAENMTQMRNVDPYVQKIEIGTRELQEKIDRLRTSQKHLNAKINFFMGAIPDNAVPPEFAAPALKM